jgi:RND family efflux transporter MFP subunit
MGGPSEVAVEVAMVERIALTRSVGVSGVVAPLRMVGVNSRVAGSVLELHVEEGDAVREGDLLALLDGRELEAALAAAEASYQVAEAALERAERLRERQVITVPEYEAERTAHAAARAQLDQLQTRLGYTRVTAPAAGVVVEKSIEAGDVVNTNARLFSLAEVSTLVVRVGVSELDVVQISVGDEAEVRLDALPQGAFTGRVRRIFPSADPETRLVPVEVALESAAGQIARPGFLARVNFALDARVDALVVPQSALLAGAASDAVFVVEDGRALRRSVERGLTSQGRVEILDGLREGETVVTVGHNNLRDGAEVRVVARDGQTSTASGDDDASRPATDDQP